MKACEALENLFKSLHKKFEAYPNIIRKLSIYEKDKFMQRKRNMPTEINLNIEHNKNLVNCYK